MSLGIKNRNPWNVKTPEPTTWNGQVGEDQMGHAIFDDPAFSCRAAIKTLYTYYKKGRRSPQQIFERYTPDNSAAYALFVARHVGLSDITENLDIFSPDGSIRDTGRLKDVLRAMADWESYEDVIRRGVELYEKDVK